MSADESELRYQYRRYREDTGGHFGRDGGSHWEGERHHETAAVSSMECLRMVFARYADAVDHLGRFVALSAKKMGIPASERSDVSQDAICEILSDLGSSQFGLLIESIAASDKIVDALRESRRGLAARRAIKRVLARVRIPQLTFTDIGIGHEIDDGS